MSVPRVRPYAVTSREARLTEVDALAAAFEHHHPYRASRPDLRTVGRGDDAWTANRRAPQTHGQPH